MCSNDRIIIDKVLLRQRSHVLTVHVLIELELPGCLHFDSCVTDLSRD